MSVRRLDAGPGSAMFRIPTADDGFLDVGRLDRYGDEPSAFVRLTPQDILVIVTRADLMGAVARVCDVPAVGRAVQVLAGAKGVSDPVGLAAELVAAGVVFPEGAE